MSSIMAKKVESVNQTRDAGADGVVEAMHGVLHLFRARQLRALRDSGLALTHGEGRVLGFFARQPGATLSELVAWTGRDKGQMAKLVAGLRERGLLAAGADAADRRVVRLQLSEEGLAAQLALRRQAKRLEALAVRGLAAQERAELLSLLERVRSSLGEADPS